MTKKKLLTLGAGAAGGVAIGEAGFSMLAPRLLPMIPAVVAKPVGYIAPWAFRAVGAALGIFGADKLVK